MAKSKRKISLMRLSAQGRKNKNQRNVFTHGICCFLTKGVKSWRLVETLNIKESVCCIDQINYLYIHKTEEVKDVFVKNWIIFLHFQSNKIHLAQEVYKLEYYNI